MAEEQPARFTYEGRRTLMSRIAPFVALGLPFACALVARVVLDPLGIMLLIFSTVPTVLAGIAFTDAHAARGLVTRPRRKFEVLPPGDVAGYRDRAPGPSARVDGRVLEGAPRVVVRIDQLPRGGTRYVTLIRLASEVIQLGPLGEREARAQAEAIARALDADPPGEPLYAPAPGAAVTGGLVAIVLVEFGGMIPLLAIAVPPRGQPPSFEHLLVAAAGIVAVTVAAGALMVPVLRLAARRMVRDLF